MTAMPADRRAYNEQLIEQFRAGPGAPDGRQVLLLTTTGRRTGVRRTTPMMFIRQEGRLVVVASNAGAVADPDWFLNLVADPRVHVEIEADSYDATAVVPEGEERDRIFGPIAEQYPFFADHQAGIERTIPVVVLER